jgi:hypothetical protein
MTRDAACKIFDSLKPDKSGCVNFVGVRGTARPGYRSFIQVDGLQVPANRFALERKLGRSIAPGFQARHTCGNPSCVAPDHLVETMNGRSAA